MNRCLALMTAWSTERSAANAWLAVARASASACHGILVPPANWRHAAPNLVAVVTGNVTKDHFCAIAPRATLGNSASMLRVHMTALVTARATKERANVRLALAAMTAPMSDVLRTALAMATASMILTANALAATRGSTAGNKLASTIVTSRASARVREVCRSASATPASLARTATRRDAPTTVAARVFALS